MAFGALIISSFSEEIGDSSNGNAVALPLRLAYRTEIDCTAKMFCAIVCCRLVGI